MSTFPALLGLFAGLVVTAAGTDKTPPLKPPPPGRIVQFPFRIIIQKRPRFPDGQRPEPSKPVVERGLSVSIQPERKEFAGNGPLDFQVVLKNDSNASFLLYGVEHLGLTPKLVISNLENTNQWVVTRTVVTCKAMFSTVLAPGKSLTYAIVVERVSSVIPFPNPIPRPIPSTKRPPEMSQSVAAADAMICGCRVFGLVTPVATRSFVVVASAAPDKDMVSLLPRSEMNAVPKPRLSACFSSSKMGRADSTPPAKA